MSKAVLGFGVALLGGEAVPARGFLSVLGATLTCSVHPPEVKLRGGVALYGRLAQLISTLRP